VSDERYHINLLAMGEALEQHRRAQHLQAICQLTGRTPFEVEDALSMMPWLTPEQGHWILATLMGVTE